MTIKRLIGTDPDQIPRNSDLGSMAFQDAAGVTVGKLKVNTSATLLGSITGISAGTNPLVITDGNTIASGLVNNDYAVFSGQSTGLGVVGVVAGTSGHRMLFRGVKAAGTLASPTAPATGDEVVSLIGAIYDTATTQATAGITFKVDGSVSSGVAPQKIEFQTGATNSRTTRLTIGSSGAITAAGTLTVNDITAINTNSSSSALTITQSGAGNALTIGSTNLDSIGRVLVGITSARNIGITPVLQVEGTSSSSSTILITRNSADTSQPTVRFVKTRGTTTGSLTAVASGDYLGSILFNGVDGTNYIGGASISAVVDGTPGTNDLPTRLIFTTCPDGSASDLERMRIDSEGRVGIGGAPSVGQSFVVARNLTGATTCSAYQSTGVIQSDVTGSAYGYRSGLGTQATTFTLSELHHFAVIPGTFGVGSTVTNQYGFSVLSTLTGATNNYGFHSNIAAATNRWNFYAVGTAQNYFAGNTGIGGLPSGTYKLEVTGDAYISGNLTVNGTTTTINSTTISVDDINIELGSVASPTNTTADGGGITLKGTTDKTINWVNATGAWTSSEDFNLLSGKTYEINGALVLSSTTLGSSVVNSSLTSLGTLTGLSVNGDTQIGNISGTRFRFLEFNGDLFVQGGPTNNTGATIKFTKFFDTAATLTVDTQNGRVGVGPTATAPGATLDVQGDVIIEASRFDTTTTAISTTTQTGVASYAAATYRTAEFLVQVVDSTNSQYHSAKILVIHDGTTVNNVQYGVVHTASELGTFDADISGGNVRLLFTATAATTKTVKVLATMLTA